MSPWGDELSVRAVNDNQSGIRTVDDYAELLKRSDRAGQSSPSNIRDLATPVSAASMKARCRMLLSPRAVDPRSRALVPV